MSVQMWNVEVISINNDHKFFYNNVYRPYIRRGKLIIKGLKGFHAVYAKGQWNHYTETKR